ncbi:MAG: PspC domain-containing protein [Prevotella sp.]|nr:PspC domain-containing protein [Prevotella sp.]MCM1075098.1 PspC domain-containing protein [Ruminococcus sp.]
MKRTFTISISGRLFTVEEDAYALLLDYLDSLSQTFKGVDGKEIVDDIEARISDLLQDEADNGKIVFTLEDAERVITLIGNAQEIALESDEQPVTGSTENASESGSNPMSPPAVPPLCAPHKKFYRSARDKVMGGIIGGLAIRFDVSALPIRLLVVLATLCVGFFPMFIAYCIVWTVTPIADTPEKMLEQEGRPVTVANIGEMSMEASRTYNANTGNTFLNVIGALFMGFIGVIAGSVGIALTVGFVVLFVCGLVSLFNPTVLTYFMNPGEMAKLADVADGSMVLFLISMICLAFLMPCIATVWASCSVLFKTKGASRNIWITGVMIEIVAIICICCLAIIL